MTKLEQHLQEVHDELLSALEKFPNPSNTPHEAFAVIQEEIDEIWEEIKRGDLPRARAEATQAAAMLVRLLVELDIEPTHNVHSN